MGTRKPGSKGSHVIQYATNRPLLAKAIASLLLRLDIVARIQKVQQGKYLPCYHVKITGVNAQKIFLESVDGFGPRAAQAKILKQALENVSENTNVDTLPIEIFDQ